MADVIFRHAGRKRWTVIDREAVNDSRLSYRARGILVWLLDKPDGWDSRSQGIAREGIEGRDAVRAALRELGALGYLVRTKRQVAGGLWVTETDIHERPKTGNQASVNQASDSQALRDRVLTTSTRADSEKVVDNSSPYPESPAPMPESLKSRGRRKLKAVG